MRQKPTSPEQRQHISLSDFAYETVINDSIDFEGEKNISGFINKIVNHTKTGFIKDIATSEFESLKERLNKNKISEEEEKILRRLANAYKDSVIHPEENYPKDHPIKIRLNNDLYDDLYDSGDWDGDDHGISQGEYIKLLVERYARKTYFERESAYFKDRIEELTTHIEAKNLLRITMTSGKKYYFKPHRLSEAYEANYHYLIGLSRVDETKPYKIATIRISRIQGKVKKLSDSGKITKKEKEEIEKRIELSGVAYALTEPEEFTIRLTEKGRSMYNNIYHQRPMYKDKPKDNKDGTYDLTITATDIQIENYFFQFRGEAVILSPERTRDKMRRYYETGANNYKNSPDA